MTKRILSLLLALCMALTLVPAASAEGENGQLYYTYGADAVVDDLKSEAILTRIDSGSSYCNFYYLNAEGSPVEVTSDLTFEPDDPANQDAVKLDYVQNSELDGGQWILWYHGVCSGALVYTAGDGTCYRLAIAVTIPEQGFATEPELTEETYLRGGSDGGFTVGTPFYYVFPEGTVVEAVDATATANGASFAAAAEILDGKANVCQITIGALDTDAQGVDLRVTFRLSDGSSNERCIYLRDLTPAFGFRYAYGDGNFSEALFKAMPQDFGQGSRVAFFYGTQKLDVTDVKYIANEGYATSTVTASMEDDWWVLFLEGFGSGRLICTTANGETYELPVEFLLPNHGFATEPELTEETYLRSGSGEGFTIGMPFYYVFPEGTEIETADPRIDESIAAVTADILDRKNVCRITVAEFDDTHTGLNLNINFTLSDGTTPYAHIFLLNFSPFFGFRSYYEYSGEYSDHLSNNFRMECGGCIQVGFFYESRNTSDPSPLDVTEVTYTPIDGPADAITAVKCDGYWELSFDRVGSGTLTCVTAGGQSYQMTVSSTMPTSGFFSEQVFAESTLLTQFEFIESAQAPLWLMAENGFTKAEADRLNWAYVDGQGRYNTDTATYIKTEAVQREDSSSDDPRYDIKVTVLKVRGRSMTLRADTGNYHSTIRLVDNNKVMIPLATPEELTWNHERPGTMGFKAVSPFQDRARWKIYKDGNDSEPVMSITHRWNSQSMGEYKYSDHFAQGYWYDDGRATADHNMESGTYYFTVQALGDGETYLNSEIAESEKWTYVKPDTALAVPTNLRWDGRVAKWDNPNSADGSYAYCVEFYYKVEEYGGINYRNAGGIESRFGAEPEMELENWALEEHGSGEYYFRVRVLSEDITKVCNSPWSELSPVKSITDVVGKANTALDAALGKYQTGELTEDKKTALKNEVAAAQDENKSLETAMAADQGQENGTIAKIKALEELVGGAAKVAVAKDAPKGLNAEDVSIVGASLNTTVKETVTLNIGSATSDTPIRNEQYHNTIRFSMKLDGVAEKDDGHQELDVPVQITLPVPEGINPDFLVLLHHRQDGTWEQIMMPRLIWNESNRQWYVSFIVTSFSDFAMAEQRELGLKNVNQAAGKATVVIDQKTAQVVVAVYSAQGQMLGSTVHTPTADEATSGLVWLDLPTKESASTIRAFLLDKNGKPQCERNTLPLL